MLEKAAVKEPFLAFYRLIHLFDCDPVKTSNFTKPNPFFSNIPSWH